MSANKDIQTVKEESGADAYISKPFDLDHFIEVVRTQINGYPLTYKQ
jgi:DNA-binding NarL/FixJ family response regulator